MLHKVAGLALAPSLVHSRLSHTVFDSAFPAPDSANYQFYRWEKESSIEYIRRAVHLEHIESTLFASIARTLLSVRLRTSACETVKAVCVRRNSLNCSFHRCRLLRRRIREVVDR